MSHICPSQRQSFVPQLLFKYPCLLSLAPFPFPCPPSLDTVTYSLPSVPLEQINLLCAENSVLGCSVPILVLSAPIFVPGCRLCQHPVTPAHLPGVWESGVRSLMAPASSISPQASWSSASVPLCPGPGRPMASPTVSMALITVRALISESISS